VPSRAAALLPPPREARVAAEPHSPLANLCFYRGRGSSGQGRATAAWVGVVRGTEDSTRGWTDGCQTRSLVPRQVHAITTERGRSRRYTRSSSRRNHHRCLPIDVLIRSSGADRSSGRTARFASQDASQLDAGARGREGRPR
jgi:hypothetical protein